VRNQKNRGVLTAIPPPGAPRGTHRGWCPGARGWLAAPPGGWGQGRHTRDPGTRLHGWGRGGWGGGHASRDHRFPRDSPPLWKVWFPCKSAAWLRSRGGIGGERKSDFIPDNPLPSPLPPPASGLVQVFSGVGIAARVIHRRDGGPGPRRPVGCAGVQIFSRGWQLKRFLRQREHLMRANVFQEQWQFWVSNRGPQYGIRSARRFGVKLKRPSALANKLSEQTHRRHSVPTDLLSSEEEKENPSGSKCAE